MLSNNNALHLIFHKIPIWLCHERLLITEIILFYYESMLVYRTVLSSFGILLLLNWYYSLCFNSSIDQNLFTSNRGSLVLLHNKFQQISKQKKAPLQSHLITKPLTAIFSHKLNSGIVLHWLKLAVQSCRQTRPIAAYSIDHVPNLGLITYIVSKTRCCFS